MRLVDADTFKAEGRELYRDAGWDLRDVHYSQMDVECNIDMMPTIEAEPIKHGRWLRTDAYPHRIYCSECYATFIRNDEFLHLEDIPHNYCPNCGADMREVEDPYSADQTWAEYTLKE